MAITEKIKGIVDFLTQGLEQRDDVFEDMMDEAGDEYETDDDYDNARYETGNYFRTKEEAKKTVEKIKIYARLKDLALRLNEGREVNWDDSAQDKWYIYYEYNSLTTTASYGYQDLGQIYCLDKNFLEIAKQEIGEDNLKKLFE